MKRRTVTLEVEFEGATANPIDLRNAVERINGYLVKVVKAEVVSEEP